MTLRRTATLISICITVQGCASSGGTVNSNWNSSADPLEGLNRNIYAFNSTADKYILRPAASAYDVALPDPAKRGVSHFFSNLGEPLNAVNSLLQGKFDNALGSTYRFVVNSTVGVFGLFDVASNYGVARTPEDFGQTLATWGLKPGPYIMLPFAGPTTLRDGFGRALSSAAYYPINDIAESEEGRAGLFVLSGLSQRAELLGIDSTLEKQLDPYLFVKSAYDNARTNAINDGKTVVDDEEFEF